MDSDSGESELKEKEEQTNQERSCRLALDVTASSMR